MTGKNHNPCPHTGHASTCPECRDVEPMVTNLRQLAWFRRYLPENHKVMVRAIEEGSAIVTQGAH
jgi:hypothetical protein